MLKTNKNKLNIAVLISGGGTNLQALINAEKSGKISHGSLKLVISSKDDAYGLIRATQANIDNFAINKKSFSQTDFEKKIIEKLQDYNIDVIVLAGFLSILSENFTKLYPNKIINVHPSLIPSFCGAGYYGLKVHKAALDYGVKVTGATVHFVNEIPDGGQIIKQKAVNILPDDTPEVLQKRVMEKAEWQILPEAVEEVCKYYLRKE